MIVRGLGEGEILVKVYKLPVLRRTNSGDLMYSNGDHSSQYRLYT